jgi:DNA-directed RNA polymerase subunit K/omega
MKTKSMASLIDINACCEKVGNKRFDLVLIAAAKIREMRFHRMGTDKITTVSEALLEIQEGRVNPTEYLRKIEAIQVKKQSRKYK